MGRCQAWRARSVAPHDACDQALLFNFEELLTKEFGNRYALNESLSLAVQFSQVRSEQQDKAVKMLHRPLAKRITSYIDAFGSSLSTELLQGQRFSYNVFLIPKLSNHEGSSDLAVEFVKYDASKPEEMEKYTRLVSLIKPSASAGAGSIAPRTGGVAPVPVRIVDDPSAPDARSIDYDVSHPYRQKDLTANVNGRLPQGVTVKAYDIAAVRYAYNVSEEPKHCHKPKFGMLRHGDLFADWIVQSYENDNEFFKKAHEKCHDLRMKGKAAASSED